MKHLARLLLPAFLAMAGCDVDKRYLTDAQAWVAEERGSAKPNYLPPAVPAEAPAFGPDLATLPDPFHPQVRPGAGFSLQNFGVGHCVVAC